MAENPVSRMSRRDFIVTGAAAGACAALPVSAFGATGFAQGSTEGRSRDLATLTLKQASDLLRRRDVSPVELAQACLARIDRHEPAINAFITVTREQALAAAREREDEIRRGRRRGPLDGIPIA